MMIIKKLSAFCLIAGVSMSFIACNSNNKHSDSRDIQLLVDTTAYHNNYSTDSARTKKDEAEKAGNVHQSSSKGIESKSGSNSSNNIGSASKSKSSASAQGAEKKDGWSKAAQGAVIGGATGAVGGAIISKKKGAGAAVGAAVGAAGGYIIGREKDKKDGRVKKK